MDSCREKVFYLPRFFQSFWTDVRSICIAYGMDFVSLETAHEADSFLEICKNNAAFSPQYVHVGALTMVLKSPNEWFWVNSGNRITYQIKWTKNNNCLFHDVECASPKHNIYQNFVCQRYVWKGC